MAGEDDQDDDQNQQDDAEDGAQESPGAAPSQDDATDAIASAPAHEVEAHRNALGEMMQQLSDKGIDVERLAEQAGLQSTDIQEMSHGDLAGLTAYIAQNHPEVLGTVASRFPAAQGLIGMIGGAGGLGGMLGGFFGRKPQE